MKSSLICPWISIDLLWVNPFKIWTKAIEKFLPERCLLVVKGWLSWKEATKMGQNSQNNVEYTKKYSVISNTSDLYCSSQPVARHLMLWHNWDNNILTDVNCDSVCYPFKGFLVACYMTLKATLWSVGPLVRQFPSLCLSQLTLEAFFRIFHNFELGNGDHLFKGHFTNSSLSVCLSVLSFVKMPIHATYAQWPCYSHSWL